MSDQSPIDPYAGNILVQGLGPILSRGDVLTRMTYFPPIPDNITGIPKHIRLHFLIKLRDFHIASHESAKLQQTVDMMVRPSYSYRDPQSPSTWSVISGESMAHKTPRAPAMAAVAVGHSGTGKTESVLRCCSLYPPIIDHSTFPRLVGAHTQVVWQSVDVPSSGRSEDLAANLMNKWEETMERYAPQWRGRFSTTLARERRDGQKMLDEWRQVALSHFLGILHLDEIQNFFKLPSLAKRRNKNADPDDLELSIIEDQCLKSILTLTNTWQIPVFFSGTPDGVGALTKRLANVERFVTGGFHRFRLFENHSEPVFIAFLKQLVRYQYVEKPLELSAGLAELIIHLTAGVHRLIVALWIAAHRVAFERKDDDLRLEDFQKAADTYLAPVAPAVAALRSKDPKQMARYEDLIRRDDNYWSTFWSAMVSI